MSRRETQLAISLQQWRGVDQRTSPTLVQEGFFVMSRGVYFGLGDNAERVPGKSFAGLMPSAVLSMYALGDQVIIQTLGATWLSPLSELIALDLTLERDVTVGGDPVTVGGDHVIY